MKPPGTARKHLWVVLAMRDDGVDVLANLTTLRTDSDTTRVLRPGDHPFVRHDSCVHYNGMIELRVDQLRDEARRERASDDMLRRMQQGAVDAPFANAKFVRIIASQM